MKRRAPLEVPETNLDKFLRDLTQISKEHHIGIGGNPVLFLMEDDDFERNYRCDADSRIEFV